MDKRQRNTIIAVVVVVILVLAVYWAWSQCYILEDTKYGKRMCPTRAAPAPAPKPVPAPAPAPAPAPKPAPAPAPSAHASNPGDVGVDSDLSAGGDLETKEARALMETMQSGMGGGEFWWQRPGGYDESWYDNRNERNLAELVGVGVGPYNPPQKQPSFVLPRETMQPSFTIPRETMQPSFTIPRETLRSRGNTRNVAIGDGCLTGIGCGLGSTWIDPRFEPGPEQLYYHGDATWAPGSDAGGPTFGSFTPAVFQTSGTWNRYVHGFGDGSYVAPQ